MVVSSDAYHHHRADMVVMAVTSQIRRPAGAMGEVLIREWQRAGPKPSLIKPVLATIERGLILRKLGELQQQTFRLFAPLSSRSSADASAHWRCRKIGSIGAAGTEVGAIRLTCSESQDHGFGGGTAVCSPNSGPQVLLAPR